MKHLISPGGEVQIGSTGLRIVNSSNKEYYIDGFEYHEACRPDDCIVVEAAKVNNLQEKP